MAVDDKYTKSLLHFNGGDGGTVFTDEIGKIWSPQSTAQLDDAEKKFGATSGLFNSAASESIWTDHHADWNLGSADFTIDFWVKSTQTTQYATLISKSPDVWSSGNWTILTSNGSVGDITIYVNDCGTSPMLSTAGGLFNTGNWVHIAWVRYGNIWTLYVDGISKATITVAVDISDKLGRIYIGQDQTYTRHYDGWIDEFRFSKTPRWTAPFTPPATQYQTVTNYLHARRDRMNTGGVSTQNIIV